MGTLQPALSSDKIQKNTQKSELSLMVDLAGLGGRLQDPMQQSFWTNGDLKAGEKAESKILARVTIAIWQIWEKAL